MLYGKCDKTKSNALQIDENLSRLGQINKPQIEKEEEEAKCLSQGRSMLLVLAEFSFVVVWWDNKANYD